MKLTWHTTNESTAASTAPHVHRKTTRAPAHGCCVEATKQRGRDREVVEGTGERRAETNLHGACVDTTH